MQKGSKNIMGRQRGAIEHRVFVGLVSRMSDPRTSFLSRGRLNRTLRSLRTDAGHASVNLASGHAAPDREGLSVGEGDRIVHACHFAQSGQNRHHHAPPPLSLSVFRVGEGIYRYLPPSVLPSSKHPPPTPNGFTSHWPRTKRYRDTPTPLKFSLFDIFEHSEQKLQSNTMEQEMN